MAKKIHRLGSHAMATEFQILILDTSEPKALASASNALRDLEALEAELSRFQGNSDISRINHLKKNQSAPIGYAAIDCIELAREIHLQTNGAFDITSSPLIAVFSNPDKSPREPTKCEIAKAVESIGMNKIQTDSEFMTATVLSENFWIDLGGIGKGYALDQMQLNLKIAASKMLFLMLEAAPFSLLEMVLKEMVGPLVWVSRTHLQLIFKTIHLADQGSANAVNTSLILENIVEYRHQR